MKKYLVIGNPIDHSLSPKLHNFWLKKNNIEAIYERKKIFESDLNDLILEVKREKISGINVTVPFKRTAISFLDELTSEADKTKSVNTIYLRDKKIIGHNTDIEGFEKSVKFQEFNLKNQKILILGAGGVVPSIIFALLKMGVQKITVSNRTTEKALDLKKLFKDIDIVDWGKEIEFDMVINATSLGLQKNDKINLEFLKEKKNKFFYDIIYNPIETQFLKRAKELGNKVENGKMMFIHQAAAAFKIWHNIEPEINEELIEYLLND